MLELTIDGADAVTVNLRQLADRTPRAIVGGLNYAIAAARDVMVDKIASDIGLEPAKVQKELPVRNATTNTLSATLSASRKRIPLSALHAQGPTPSRGKGAGVTYQLRGGTGRLPNAFIVTLNSGHVGVFSRVPGKGRHGPKPNRSQLPIYELFGPSLGRVFAKYRPIGVARGVEAFRASFGSQISGAAGPV